MSFDGFRVQGSRLARGAEHSLMVDEKGSAGSIGSRGSRGGSAFRHPERRKTSCVKETLIQSQNQISYGFLYIVSSTFSLNSSLFASNVSSLCIKIQE